MAQPLLILGTPSPASGSGRAPRTPSRTSSKEFNAKLTTSPYFSTRKRKLSSTTANSTPSKRLTPGTDSDDDEDRLIASSSPVTDSWWEREDPTLFNDPLFCFYFRSFVRLYSQLSSVKPLLIQGTFIRNLLSSSVYTCLYIHPIESVAHDPWKLLMAVTLLNKTTGKLAIPVFWDILAKWPTPWALSQGTLHLSHTRAMLMAYSSSTGTRRHIPHPFPRYSIHPRKAPHKPLKNLPPRPALTLGSPTVQPYYSHLRLQFQTYIHYIVPFHLFAPKHPLQTKTIPSDTYLPPSRHWSLRTRLLPHLLHCPPRPCIGRVEGCHAK